MAFLFTNDHLPFFTLSAPTTNPALGQAPKRRGGPCPQGKQSLVEMQKATDDEVRGGESCDQTVGGGNARTQAANREEDAA